MRGWDGITDGFSTDIEAKFDLVCPEQVLGNIVATWLHEISDAIGVDVGPSSDLKKKAPLMIQHPKISKVSSWVHRIHGIK